MGKYAVAVALATTVLAGSADARDKAWYIGVEAGGLIAEASDFDVTGTNGTVVEDGIRLKYKPGWEVGGTLGYAYILNAPKKTILPASLIGLFGYLRIQVVQQHPQCGFLLPSLTIQC